MAYAKNPPEDYQRIADAVRDGKMTQEEGAFELGITQQALCQWMKRHRYPAEVRSYRWLQPTERDINALRQYWRRECTQQDVVDFTKRSYPVVKRWIDQGIGQEDWSEQTIKINTHGCEMPEKIEKGDWIDLRSAETVSMEAGEYRLISLGISMELPDGYEAHVAPRSSTFNKWGILLVNCIGIIDNSYCGSEDIWQFPALAFRKTTIHEGDRICQFRIIKKQPSIRFVEDDLENNKDRGGLGSTGTN